MAFKNRDNTMNAMFTTNQYKVLEVMYENTLSIADKVQKSFFSSWFSNTKIFNPNV